MNQSTQIIRLADTDPGWKNGLRYFVGCPVWNDAWDGEATGLAGHKTRTLAEAVARSGDLRNGPWRPGSFVLGHIHTTLDAARKELELYGTEEGRARLAKARPSEYPLFSAEESR